MKSNKFIDRYIDRLEEHDKNNVTYYLTVKAGKFNGEEVTLLSHIGNKNATGARTAKKQAEYANDDSHDYVLFEEYRVFSPKSARIGEIQFSQKIDLAQNSTDIAEQQGLGGLDQRFDIFGGFKGFLDARDVNVQNAFTIKNLEIEAKRAELDLAELRSKLGDFEQKNKQLVHDNDSLTSENKQLEKRANIINAGAQGLGTLIMNKIGISGNDIAGFLGNVVDAPSETPQSNDSRSKSNANIEFEEETPDTIQGQVANQIKEWLLKNSDETALKIHAVFDYLAKSEDNLDEINSII